MTNNFKIINVNKKIKNKITKSSVKKDLHNKLQYKNQPIQIMINHH